MAWVLFTNINDSQTWFSYVCSIRNYMYIMRMSPIATYNTKISEAISSYDDYHLQDDSCYYDHKKQIRQSYEVITLILDRILDREVYDLYQR